MGGGGGGYIPDLIMTLIILLHSGMMREDCAVCKVYYRDGGEGRGDGGRGGGEGAKGGMKQGVRWG